MINRLSQTVLLLAAGVGVTSGSPSPVLTASDVTIGRNLQTYTTIKLSEPAPAGGLQITITSSDPNRLVVSRMPDVAGTSSITLTVRERFRESSEFWLQALDDSGHVEYSVTAAEVEKAVAVANLTPAGIVVFGPLSQVGAAGFSTTPRGWTTKILFRTMRLNASLDPVESQYVRGGFSIEIPVLSSAPDVGAAVSSSVVIPGAADTAATDFKPAHAGKTTLSVAIPAGFRRPARFDSVLAEVRTPGIAVADDMVIGENLQVAAALSLGEPAPEGGIDVTLTTDSPEKILLSSTATEVGKPSLRIHMPAGSVNTTYYLQALGRSGTVKHTGSAPGYLSRTGTLALAPSGVILSPEKHGPPDEAELFRPHTAGSDRNLFVALLSENKPTPLVLYTAYLDPRTRRSADITVQSLRAGLSVDVDLKNTNPAVADVAERVRVQGATERTVVPLKALKVGETVVSVAAPDGFAVPSNSTEVQLLVRE